MAGAAQPLPHHYRARATGTAEGSVIISSSGLPAVETQAPPEFGGPAGYWSPESLLLASVADCYVLTFRAVARAAKLEWLALDVEVAGVLDRAEGATRFTQLKIAPRLGLPSTESESTALAALEKAKRACLITNSLNARCELATLVYSVAESAAAQ